MTWRLEALCQDTDHRIFFVKHHGSVTCDADNVCQRCSDTIDTWCEPCPVSDDCLRDVLRGSKKDDRVSGIRGGKTPEQRVRIRNQAWAKARKARAVPSGDRKTRKDAGKERKPIVHGTVAGQRKHYRRGEPICDECRLAYNEDLRKKRAAS